MTPAQASAEWRDIAIRDLAERHGLAQADAARELLKAIAAWFGIDFDREVEKLED